MVTDEWIRAAMMDDRLVVELLLRLKQAQEAAPAKPHPVIPFRWGLRLPRSKPAAAASVLCDVVCGRKEGDSSARCSPTTPLSWSGGGGAASPSATVDGFEDTSPHVIRSTPGARSKVFVSVNAAAETASITTKKSRRKKTFAELKEEESSLLKERIHLKKELATLNSTFKEQIARNENLKRIKLDLNLQLAKNPSLVSDVLEKPICNQPSSPNHINSMLPINVQGDDNDESDSGEMQDAVSNHDRSFLLPDLNMMPSEDPDTKTLPGMR